MSAEITEAHKQNSIVEDKQQQQQQDDLTKLLFKQL